MRQHKYNPVFKFVENPIEFNKYLDKEQLQFCLGGTLYMPGTKKIDQSIIANKIPELTSMVMCFEDAIDLSDLDDAENNVLHVLDEISTALKEDRIRFNDIPLFFLRVRNYSQFKSFSEKLTANHVKIITGFVFPKFGCCDGYLYLRHLEALNQKFNEVLYGMPILESKEIAFKESRIYELIGIQNMLKPFKHLILNVRVGATDFSSKFGVRRGMDYSIYDIITIKECLSDILNFLCREGDDYVISAPVWEYFLTDKDIKIDDTNGKNIHGSLLKRNLIVNDAIDGLLREVILDKANGFVGKTVIHPTHLKYVNAMQAVTQEEYEDAVQILEATGGVIKSKNGNKMNEINPHTSWAQKTYLRAKAFGVIENEAAYSKLFCLNK